MQLSSIVQGLTERLFGLIHLRPPERDVERRLVNETAELITSIIALLIVEQSEGVNFRETEGFTTQNAPRYKLRVTYEVATAEGAEVRVVGKVGDFSDGAVEVDIYRALCTTERACLTRKVRIKKIERVVDDE